MDLQPERTAFIFPGQGSQTLGMGQALAAAYPQAGEVFTRADEQLGFPLSGLAWDGPEEALNDTINTQPTLLVHSVAALKVFQALRPEFQPAFVAGHSMGEISALVAAGALPFAGGLALARRRGELMKEAGEIHPGGMAAVLGLDIPALDHICAQASLPGEVVQVANDNCPGQCVISGSAAALERAIPLAQEAGARKVVRLAVSIAAHSPLMGPAQDSFARAVAEAPLNDAPIPVIGNVSAAPIERASALRQDLNAQLTSRVRWTDTIRFLADQGITHLLELGPGNVLCGLLKRIDRSLTGIPLGTPEDFQPLG